METHAPLLGRQLRVQFAHEPLHVSLRRKRLHFLVMCLPFQTKVTANSLEQP